MIRKPDGCIPLYLELADESLASPSFARKRSSAAELG